MDVPAHLADQTVESLLAEHARARPWTYAVLLLGAIAGLASLPAVEVDVSVRAPGIVRSATGRSELTPAASGRVVRVRVRDNDAVTAGQVLLELATGDLDERLAHNRARQAESAEIVADLDQLVGGAQGGVLRTAVLRQELVAQAAECDARRLAETKARSELARYTALAEKGIATRQELENAHYGVERLQAESRAQEQQVLGRWQARLREERAALAALASEAAILTDELARSVLRAPVDGVVLDLGGLAPGRFVSAGQTIGTISPGDALVVEAQVPSRDVGLVRAGQSVRLQVDAYPYTYWGMLDGVVTSVSRDRVGAAGAGQSAAVFQVLIRPKVTELTVRGVRAQLKVGLTLTARFHVARRSLLELLCDDASAWLNPLDPRAAT